MAISFSLKEPRKASNANGFVKTQPIFYREEWE